MALLVRESKRILLDTMTSMIPFVVQFRALLGETSVRF